MMVIIWNDLVLLGVGVIWGGKYGLFFLSSFLVMRSLNDIVYGSS